MNRYCSSGPLLAAAVVASALWACGDGGDDALHSGDIATWAGDGTQGHDGDGHPRTESWLNGPMELVFSPAGLAYIVDWNNHAIRIVDSDDTLTTLVGTPLPGDWPCQVPADPSACDVPLDGRVDASTLSLNHPMDLALQPNGDLVIAAWHNHKLEYCATALGEVSVVAGQQSPGFSGDGGAASEARLNFPDSVVVDESGAILVSDQRNNRVRRVGPDDEPGIATVAGSNAPPAVSAFAGDGGPAVEALFGLSPYDEAGGADNPPPGGGLALDADGNLYIADTFNHCVRRIAAGSDGLIGIGDPSEEIVETVAGRCGESGFGGDGGPATEALLSHPHDVEIGPDGELFIADTRNHAVRVVNLDSAVIDRVAGTGEAGYAGDGGPAIEAQLKLPYGLAFDPAGTLYIVDTGNNVIRRVEP